MFEAEALGAVVIAVFEFDDVEPGVDRVVEVAGAAEVTLAVVVVDDEDRCRGLLGHAPQHREERSDDFLIVLGEAPQAPL